MTRQGKIGQGYFSSWTTNKTMVEGQQRRREASQAKKDKSNMENRITPQPRRRSDRFDCTLGFPGESPSQFAGVNHLTPTSTSGGSGQWSTSKGNIPSFPGGLTFCSHTTESAANTKAHGPRYAPCSSHISTVVPVRSAGGQFCITKQLRRDLPDGRESHSHSSHTIDYQPRLVPTGTDSGRGDHDTLPTETDDSTPAPLEPITELQPTSATRGRKTGRPSKRQKTLPREDLERHSRKTRYQSLQV
jgi:hypothetical protein